MDDDSSAVFTAIEAAIKALFDLDKDTVKKYAHAEIKKIKNPQRISQFTS